MMLYLAYDMSPPDSSAFADAFTGGRRSPTSSCPDLFRASRAKRSSGRDFLEGPLVRFRKLSVIAGTSPAMTGKKKPANAKGMATHNAISIATTASGKGGRP